MAPNSRSVLRTLCAGSLTLVAALAALVGPAVAGADKPEKSKPEGPQAEEPRSEDSESSETSVVLAGVGRYQLCAFMRGGPPPKCKVSPHMKHGTLTVTVTHPPGEPPAITLGPCPDGQLGAAVTATNGAGGMLSAVISGRDPITGEKIHPIRTEEVPVSDAGSTAEACLYSL